MTFFQSPTEIKNLKSANSFVIAPASFVNMRVKSRKGERPAQKKN